MTVEQFEQTVAVRHFGGFDCNDYKYKNLTSLDEAIHLRWEGISDDEVASLRDSLTLQLKVGAFHYLAVAQHFTSTALRTVDYMNATMPKPAYTPSRWCGLLRTALVPLSRGPFRKPTSATGGGAGGAGGSAVKTIDEQHFLDSISDLNFGFDPGSAKLHPTFLRALDSYAADLAEIIGATPVVKGNLKSFHFAPDAAARSILQVKEAIGQVVTAISRGGVEET